MRAGQIRAQHRVPIFELHAQRKSVARDRGVVHQNVEPAEFRERLLKAGFTCAASATSIGTASASPPAASISATSDASFSVFRAATATFAPASASARDGRAADSLRRTGDESHFVFERKHSS